ncbi:unnamed protein product [Arabidopsis halleri]
MQTMLSGEEKYIVHLCRVLRWGTDISRAKIHLTMPL